MSMITKMLVMRNGGNGSDGGQMRGGNYGGYNRDRSGYNEYNVDTINYGGEIENRRRRDSRGRFMESDGGRMEMRGGDMRMPPRYPRFERGTGGIENRIGYDMRGDDEEPEMYWPPYWRGGDMHHGGERERGEMQRGHGKGGKMSFMPMDERTAKKWVHAMQNADGSEGEKWSMEQAEQIMRQAGIDCEPAEFYAILNAIHSDFGKVAKKHKIDTVEYYVDMAKAWLHDKDAVKNKASAYYECVVKHEE